MNIYGGGGWRDAGPHRCSAAGAPNPKTEALQRQAGAILLCGPHLPRSTESNRGAMTRFVMARGGGPPQSAFTMPVQTR